MLEVSKCLMARGVETLKNSMLPTVSSFITLASVSLGHHRSTERM